MTRKPFKKNMLTKQPTTNKRRRHMLRSFLGLGLVTVLATAWIGCATSSPKGTSASVDHQAVGGQPGATAQSAAGGPSDSTARKPSQDLSWMKPPAAIGGNWRLSQEADCRVLKGMEVTIEISPDNPKSATGRVLRLGTTGQLGYNVGDLVLKLEANDFGNWRGQAKWRSIIGAKRWDPIYFVMEGETLKATMSVDHCWRSMTSIR